MKVNKAVITAAGRAQRSLPLHRFVDRDGQEKTALQIIIEEVLAAGVQEIAVVICPGDEAAYREAAGSLAGRLCFMEQDHPRGYGDALLRTRSFVGNEAFVHLVSDHLYISRGTDGGGIARRCAQELVEVARTQGCTVSAVQATRETMLPYYGTIGGEREPQQQKLYAVREVIEKPTPTQAEQRLLIPGLRAGYYLCLFGMHVLTPVVLEILAQLQAAQPRATVQLSPALSELARRERYLALEIHGARYNIGVKYGLLTAQLALAMSGSDRQEVLEQLVELLAANQAVA